MSELPDASELANEELASSEGEPPYREPPAWTAGLPGPDAELAAARGGESPAELLRQYRDLEAMVGPDQVRIPGDSSSPEEVEAFWSRLGRPSTPEGYAFSPGETATGYDTALSNWFREAAHAVHMPADMAQALHDRFREQAATARAQQWQSAEHERQHCESQLRRDWGRSYDARLEDARRAVERLGGDTLKQVFNDSGLGDHPALVRAFADIGRLLAGTASATPQNGSDVSEGRENALSKTIPTATQAQREIMRLRSDGAFMAAYGDRTHPSHDVAQQQMDELYARAYPAGAVRR